VGRNERHQPDAGRIAERLEDVREPLRRRLVEHPAGDRTAACVEVVDQRQHGRGHGKKCATLIDKRRCIDFG